MDKIDINQTRWYTRKGTHNISWSGKGNFLSLKADSSTPSCTNPLDVEPLSYVLSLDSFGCDFKLISAMMYSLYRAWLMRDAVTAASLTTPPDIVILVGTEEQQFLAHRQLVSAHSGYLKSLLHDAVGTVSVPSVMPDTFGLLLTFMYTGYLDLNQDNIYSILLGTHLLHMPRALELCREYLMHQQPSPFQFSSNTNIVKPIPSRKVFNYAQPFWTPPALPTPLLLQPSPDGPFQSVAPTDRPSPTIEPMPGPSKSHILPIPSPTTHSVSSTSVSVTSDDLLTQPKNIKKTKKINDENLKAVLDVACCDGPVQFHRVLNESYGMSAETSKPEDLETTDKKFSNFMHQQMLNSNLYKKSKTCKGVIQLRKVVEKEVESNENDIYTCVHCNHSFKSQFCYEKHVRRHINHVDKVETPDVGGGRREVRLLDMNVQYYPCKTCGSKFPSYYFVHKHRKLCHSGEDDASTDKPLHQ